LLQVIFRLTVATFRLLEGIPLRFDVAHGKSSTSLGSNNHSLFKIINGKMTPNHTNIIAK
jgi:hypothetical protein